MHYPELDHRTEKAHGIFIKTDHLCEMSKINVQKEKVDWWLPKVTGWRKWRMTTNGVTKTC